MSTWLVVVIIALVFGVIIGNLLLLRASAKQPLPKTTKDNNAHYEKDDDQ
ncbi:MAG: DUF2897 family protein [Paraglaciecola sp.]|nr:DUF2897 family protein [Paraglaciecola sp.]NCT47094.1 DUF2897 family protein [Paraglaciecola sp.]